MLARSHAARHFDCGCSLRLNFLAQNTNRMTNHCQHGWKQSNEGLVCIYVYITVLIRERQIVASIASESNDNNSSYGTMEYEAVRWLLSCNCEIFSS